MIRAVWNGKVLAESVGAAVIEGNHYFPLNALHKEFFCPSATQTVCPWKGVAHYCTLSANGALNPDAAWYYPDPKPAAQNIAGRVAFWKGVRIETV